MYDRIIKVSVEKSAQIKKEDYQYFKNLTWFICNIFIKNENLLWKTIDIQKAISRGYSKCRFFFH